MRRVERAVEKSIQAIYQQVRMPVVPVFFASSPVVGAFMACILAHQPKLSPERAQLEAERLAFGKPTPKMIERYRSQMTHAKAYGNGAHKGQPGSGAHRKITLGLMRNQMATHRDTFWTSLGLEPIDQVWFLVQRQVIHMATMHVRTRLHQLFKQRVQYHPWIIKEALSASPGLSYNRFWIPGNHAIIWPNRRFAVVSKEPKRLHLNERGQLHYQRGDAVLYHDGWGIAAINGIPVPNHFLSNPQMLTVDAIVGIDNMEVRRALIELKGFAAWLKESRADLLDDDLDGELRPRKLYAVPAIPNLNMLEVVNSTPETDGSYKNYYLTVPAHITTCADAIAWMLDDRMEHRLEYRIES